jgi:tRNA dimethylallyltransferase
MQKLLAIVGPTASGKSLIALHAAGVMGGEIVSADSRQIYKYLDIGTAKPSLEDRRRIPHYFVDIFNPDKEYSAGEFGRDARVQIQQIGSRGKTPILVGGSGLYVKAVVDGFFEGPGKDPETRLRLENRLKEEGPESLVRTLRAVDPSTAAAMDITKPRRIIRALEVFYITGKPLSQFHREQSTTPPFEVVQVGFSWPRELLYKRINDRVNFMFSAGLIEELERLRAMGYSLAMNALNTVGYREVFDYLSGKTDMEETIELVKRNSRRFAKRQMTWFRSDRRIRWIRTDETRTIDELVDQVREQFIGS